MLVLTRKQNETIQIGDSITITVLRMKGKSVRLGIKAPHEFNVIRGELAFEQSNEQDVATEIEDGTTNGTSAKPRPRNCGSHRETAWSTKSEASTILKAGCSAAWSV